MRHWINLSAWMSLPKGPSSPRWVWGLNCCLLGLACGGCSMLTNRSASSGTASPVNSLLNAGDSELAAAAPGSVANPPAKSIRFDGHEVLLGSSKPQELPPRELDRRLGELLEAQKRFSAHRLIAQNQSAAEQLLWELAGQSNSREKRRLLADALSRGVDPAVSWNGFLAQADMKSQPANAYYSLRNAFASRLRSQQPSDAECEQLRTAAQAVGHPLATIDALHLFGVRELVANRNAWAEALFLQGAEVAEKNRDDQRAANAWTMVLVTAQANGDTAQAERSWLKAIELQVQFEQSANNDSLHPFWSRAAELRPGQTSWPNAVAGVLMRQASEVDCPLDSDSQVELIVHAALGADAYATNHPQIALVHLKQAEQHATPEQVLWLRIAQGRCLASLGQTPAAAALLSSPAASSKPEIASAALAAIGSAKLHAGAYQQGAQLLHKALGETATRWPSRTHSEADLALATLIIGETDAGVERLAAVQQKFEAEGNIAALLDSLENHRELCEHEGRLEEATQIRSRIATLERGAAL